jgi:DNA invertase Pin-like site-specific DNA recombinase
VNELREWDVEFVFLRESINTTPPGGKLVFHVFGAVAALERDLILERTMGGLVPPGRGRRDGRQLVMGEGKIALVSKLMRDRETPVSAVCATVSVYRATLYR